MNVVLVLTDLPLRLHMNLKLEPINFSWPTQLVLFRQLFATDKYTYDLIEGGKLGRYDLSVPYVRVEKRKYFLRLHFKLFFSSNVVNIMHFMFLSLLFANDK